MKVGLIFRPFSFWIGIHYSKYNKRFCINIIPFITIRIVKNGGKAPGKINEIMEQIFEEIRTERERQEQKWGEQNHPCLDPVLLERDESCTPIRMCDNYEIPTENRAKFMCDSATRKGQLTYAHIAIEEMSEVVSTFDEGKRREELVQLAAVTVAWIQKIDRNKK